MHLKNQSWPAYRPSKSMSGTERIVRHLYNAELCTGCSACVNICPRGVLSFQPDAEGFARPVIRAEDNCINCGLCLKVCVTHDCSEQKNNRRPQSFIAQSKHTRKTKKSSSGGAFYEIARAFISQYDGIAAGAAFDEENTVRHIIADDIRDLRRIQGSKYVQSDVKSIFTPVKKLLEQGVYVVFSGTPCQVYGFKKFLRKDYDNLITIDLICHGVPSPMLLNYHIRAIENNRKDQVRGIRFRWKNPCFSSGSSFYMMMMMKHGLRYVRIGKKDAYMNLFLNGIAFRESCYRCRFANTQREGDFTIGDCDSHRFYPDFHPEESNSTLFLNTDKAEKWWKEIFSKEFDFAPLDLAREAQCNKQLSAPYPRPEYRDTIYKEIKEMSLDESD